MELVHLRVFVRAAELESFTRAGDALGLAQPTVSRIVAELEAEWGGPLFRRTGRGVALSELGREALRRVRPILSEVAQISDDVRAFDREPAGEVSLALTPSLTTAVLPALVNELQAERPGIRLRVYEGYGAQIERWISDEVASFGVFSRYGFAGEDPGVSRDLLGGPLPAGFVLSRGRSFGPLPAEIDFAELARYPLVMAASSNAWHIFATNAARRFGVRLNVVAGADSRHAQDTIALNCGFCLLRDQGAAGVVPDDRFADARVRAPDIVRQVVLSTLPASRLSRATQDVIDRTTRILRTLWRAEPPAGNGA